MSDVQVVKKVFRKYVTEKIETIDEIKNRIRNIADTEVEFENLVFEIGCDELAKSLFVDEPEV